MSRVKPVQLVLMATALLLMGWLLAFLMVLKVIQSTFFLNFLAYTLQLAGFFLGFISITMFIRVRKK
jgi:positive regulator of sigma E activity